MFTQLKIGVVQQRERIVGLEAQIVELNAKIDTLTKMLFGKKTDSGTCQIAAFNAHN